MKRIFTMFLLGFLVCMTGVLKSQTLAITEINYNDPSAGNNGDSLEFVEIYNILPTPIDLTGYKLTSGLTYTFISMDIPGHSYVIIAKNAAAVNNFLSVTGTLQWDAGQALSNNGEAVVLKDANNNLVDSVRYYTTAPWPTIANGLGGSLMKCDPNAMSNLASSWVGGNITNANIYGTILNYTVFTTPLLGCVTPQSYTPVYSLLPFNESFDNIWMNGDNYRDVPTDHWRNIPGMGNNSWRKADDGISAYWTNMTTGAYLPAGANNTTSSARFHTASATAGSTGILQMYLDFNLLGTKKLKFWYNNTAGTDSLAVYMSENGGTTFNFLQKFTTTTGWEEKQIILGTTSSTSAIIKFVATSNNTANDIGLDEVSVIAAPDNDAGISAITSPANMVFSPNQNLTVSLSNFGGLTLTSATIDYTINGVAGTSIPWTGSIASGAVETGIVLSPITIAPSTMATIKVWTSNPNGVVDGDLNNDTLSKSSFHQTRTTVPFEEHFDSIWTNKFSSRDVASSYWMNTPATGNNSWRRDDDGASAGWGAAGTGAYTPAGALGTIHSARFHTSGNAVGGTVGILDLYLDFSTLTGVKELKYYHINSAGQDSVAVWISYDNGTTFNFLRKDAIDANWALKVVNLGPSISNEVVLRFKATSNQGGNTDPGIDEVSISTPLPDMSVLAISKPITGCGLSNEEQVKVLVKNTGSMAINNIPIVYHVDGNTVAETIADSLHPGDTLTYTFNAIADLSGSGIHNISAKVNYPGDYMPSNDSMAKTIYNIMQINTFPFVEDFESGDASYQSLTHGTNAIIGVENAIGNNSSFGLRMAGNVAGTWPSGSGTNTTATLAWNTYTDHQAFAMTCLVDGTSLNMPELKLDLKQTFVAGGGNKYSWFRVLINDTVQLADNAGVINFNPVTSNSDQFVTHSFNLSAYAHSQFKLTLQSSCKYSDAGSGAGLGDNVFIDNLKIRERPPIEVSMENWVTPVSSCGMSSHETVSIRMKNQGSSSVGMIPVSYSIDNGANWHSEVCPASIDPDSILVFQFAGSADFSTVGMYNCIAAVSFPGDADPTNDTIYFKVTSIPFVTINAFYQENFENGPAGWSSASIAGIDEWVVGTPAKPNLNSAHSGTQAYVTNLTQNYAINSNTYIVSPCFDFSSLLDPHLWVWMRFRTENNYDAMIMEVSVNDSAWYKITADAGFYNNTSPTPPVTPPKWSGNNVAWTRYITSLPGLAHKAKVQFRFRFESDYTQVDEGIAIDDIAIFDPFPDAAIVKLLEPVSGCNHTSTEAVTIIVKNDGFNEMVGVPISYRVDNSPPVNELYLGTLLAGETDTVTFVTPADLSAPGLHHVGARTIAVGDFNNFNDTLVTDVFNPTSSGVPMVADFENPTSMDHLSLSSSTNSGYEILPGAGALASVGVMLTGGGAGTWPNNSDTNTTALQAWGYTSHLSELYTCTITIPTAPSVGLYFDLKQTFSQGNKYSWVRVLVNDTIQIADIFGNMNFNPSTPDTDPFENHLFILDSYAPDLKVTIQASCKYDEARSPVSTFDAAFIDNFKIDILESIPELVNPNIKIYPNPACDVINLSFNNSMANANIEIINMQGQTVLTANCSGKQIMTVDIKSLSAGVYTVKVNNDKDVKMLRFVKTL